MKITVVGLGAVGGLMAARLALAGHPVSALARGATLAAVRAQGVRLQMAGAEHRAEVRATDDPVLLGPQDLVVIALKGQALPGLAPTLAPLIGANTTVLTAMNGVPWWFLRTPALAQRLSRAQQQLLSIDPDGHTDRALPVSQVLGCVVHLSCSQPEPGMVAHGFGHRLIVGAPEGGTNDRVQHVQTVLSNAGFQTEASTDIRRDIWYKLWGNMTMNPVSALTGATGDRILDDPLVRQYMIRTMAEAAAVGAEVGCPIEQSGEERLSLARELGAFKTSMLQDTEAGRPLEIDALVTVVQEIGVKLGVPTPQIDTLLGLTRLMARTRGLYPL